MTTVLLVVLSQFAPRPLPIGREVPATVTLGTGKASASFNTGFLPFEAEFLCTFDTFQTSTLSGGLFGAAMAGSLVTDCGFNGPDRLLGPGAWSYVAFVRFGYRVVDQASLVPIPYTTTFTLDGARLVWP